MHNDVTFPDTLLLEIQSGLRVEASQVNVTTSAVQCVREHHTLQSPGVMDSHQQLLVGFLSFMESKSQLTSLL